jgi:hypothetical protein
MIVKTEEAVTRAATVMIRERDLGMPWHALDDVYTAGDTKTLAVAGQLQTFSGFASVAPSKSGTRRRRALHRHRRTERWMALHRNPAAASDRAVGHAADDRSAYY